MEFVPNGCIICSTFHSILFLLFYIRNQWSCFVPTGHGTRRESMDINQRMTLERHCQFSWRKRKLNGFRKIKHLFFRTFLRLFLPSAIYFNFECLLNVLVLRDKNVHQQYIQIQYSYWYCWVYLLHPQYCSHEFRSFNLSSKNDVFWSAMSIFKYLF